MRLFVAVALDEPVRLHLGRVQTALRSLTRGCSWPVPANLHLTLKFLGDVPDDQVPALTAALSHVTEPAADAPCPIPRSITLRPTSLGFFPPAGRINIVHTEMSGDVPALESWQQAIEAACEPLGFPPEPHAFRPHVTLARARRPLDRELRQPMLDAAAKLWPGPEMTATAFSLVQSVLDSAGARYTTLARFAF